MPALTRLTLHLVLRQKLFPDCSIRSALALPSLMSVAAWGCRRESILETVPNCLLPNSLLPDKGCETLMNKVPNIIDTL